MRMEIIQLAYDALAILVPALVALGIAWLGKRLGVEGMAKLRYQLETKQALAEAAVLFVQQVYYAIDGPQKYECAAEWLAGRASEMGLPITDLEIQGLIESALKLLKTEFGEQWEQADPEPLQ